MIATPQFIKVVRPDSFGFDDRIARLVKSGSRGLRGHDLGEFIKRAGHDFLPYLDEVRPGEVPVHLFALGATETTGSNRNGDGFSRRWCELNHDTFVKRAHAFREHRNKPHDLRYGRVIKSAFHAPMGRVELLVGYYATPEAARAGGGHLGRVADDELEKLAADGFDTSMACTIDHDVCVACKNEAKHRGEYCDTKPVKLASGRVIPACTAFGCRNGLTKVAADGFIQYVDNPDPQWFDISNVHRRADRIAFSLGRLDKVASAGRVVGGAELAEAYGLSAASAADADSPKLARARDVLAMLVAAEADGAGRYAALDLGLAKSAFSPLPAPPAVLRDEPSSAPDAYRALADANAVLHVDDWLVLNLGKSAGAEAVAAVLPGMFERLAADPNVDGLLAGNAYAHGLARPAAAWRYWAQKCAASATRSFAYADIAHRTNCRILSGFDPYVPARSIKVAAAPDGPAATAAREYALYQVGFLAARPGTDSENLRLTALLLARQNRVG